MKKIKEVERLQLFRRRMDSMMKFCEERSIKTVSEYMAELEAARERETDRQTERIITTEQYA